MWVAVNGGFGYWVVYMALVVATSGLVLVVRLWFCGWLGVVGFYGLFSVRW